MSDVVLVHGTTQDAAGFGRLVDALERRGRRATTVDVDGPASAPVAEHADLMAAQLPSDLEQPVMLAHSAAGLLPALAERLHVAPVEVPGGHNSFMAHPEPIAEAVDRVT